MIIFNVTMNLGVLYFFIGNQPEINICNLF